jgi:hypothetical protein
MRRARSHVSRLHQLRRWRQFECDFIIDQHLLTRILETLSMFAHVFKSRLCLDLIVSLSRCYIIVFCCWVITCLYVLSSGFCYANRKHFTFAFVFGLDHSTRLEYYVFVKSTVFGKVVFARCLKCFWSVLRICDHNGTFVDYEYEWCNSDLTNSKALVSQHLLCVLCTQCVIVSATLSCQLLR